MRDSVFGPRSLRVGVAPGRAPTVVAAARPTDGTIPAVSRSSVRGLRRYPTFNALPPVLVILINLGVGMNCLMVGRVVPGSCHPREVFTRGGVWHVVRGSSSTEVVRRSCPTEFVTTEVVRGSCPSVLSGQTCPLSSLGSCQGMGGELPGGPVQTRLSPPPNL